MLKELMPSLPEILDSAYDDIKTFETDSIIQQSLQGVSSKENPILLQISGIPGAGKSTYCKTHLMPDFLYISFDNIMLELLGYKDEVVKNGIESAYKKYEMPARAIGYELLNQAIKLKLNIMLEHSGTNKAHLELFKNIKNKGYQTAVNFIVCDVGVALKRSKDREIEQKRHVPEELILERAKFFNNFIEEYSGVTSNINIYDGSNNFSLLKKI